MMQQPIAELEVLSDPRRRRPFLWIVSGLAVVALIAGALALAGNDDETKSAATVVLSEAAARTTGQGTARATFVLFVTAGGKTTKFMESKGAYDYGAKASTTTMKFTTFTERIVVLQHVAYVSTEDELPQGAHWVAITAADAKIDPSAIATLDANNPSSGLRFLAAVNGDPHVVGTEKVDGSDVTHYEFTIDFQAMIDRVGKVAEALDESGFGASLKALGSTIDLTKIPGAAWIDRGGRIRKFDMTIEVPAQGEDGEIKYVQEFRFSHFDEPVDVQAPPASDTVPFSQVPNVFSGGESTATD